MSLAMELEALSTRFCELHTRKEDLFWTTKMGLADDPERAGREMATAEIELQRFLSDPERLASLRALEATQASEREKHTLSGWIRVFAANAIESREARALAEEIVELEGEIDRTRRTMKLGYVDPDTGAHVMAGSNKLGLLQKTHPDARVRKAAYEGMRSIEPFVLGAGFLEIVKKRNKLAKTLGYEDYYAWRVHVVERMTKARLFAVLDDLAARTKAACDRALSELEKAHGPEVRDPWQLPFVRSGSLVRELEPYFGFAPALERWAQSFHAMAVRYRGATLTLDLVDREGKYDNGFMHGPEPAFFDRGTWRPARIGFTANAVAGQMGSGMRATQTLFHEGGHAAHFANILADAPCFSQEFAPTSVAYAETQSMFMDSLLDDGDFRARYALNDRGESMPIALIEEAAAQRQLLRAFDVRAMLTVPFAERRLYELSDDELTPDRVLEEFRRVERDLQGLSAGVRPVLAVPHLLAGESSAYYHGYVLAEMAVEQTRAFFLGRDGALTDNPRVGRDLAEHYWRPGNAITFDETLESLTSAPLSADALVAACNRSRDEQVSIERDRAKRATPARPAKGIDLDATIRVVHGRELVATTDEGGLDGAIASFRAFIEGLEAKA